VRIAGSRIRSVLGARSSAAAGAATAARHRIPAHFVVPIVLRDAIMRGLLPEVSRDPWQKATSQAWRCPARRRRMSRDTYAAAGHHWTGDR
jgi:hypothetical protein